VSASQFACINHTRASENRKIAFQNYTRASVHHSMRMNITQNGL
jgi:archaellum component FlaF (FlaF/FlaG flagellin family)